MLKRHAANHENDGDSTKKRRRTDTSPGAGRVSRACRACATARVKCEEAKPCTRCRNRGMDCDYVSEPGSAAAMHLLHLSANAHANSSASLSPSPSSHTLPPSHSPLQYQPAQAGSIQAPASQGLSYSNTPVTTSTPPFKIEEGQLPTPDATADQSRSTKFNIKSGSILHFVVYIAVVSFVSYPGFGGPWITYTRVKTNVTLGKLHRMACGQ